MMEFYKIIAFNENGVYLGLKGAHTNSDLKEGKDNKSRNQGSYSSDLYCGTVWNRRRGLTISKISYKHSVDGFLIKA